MAGSDRDHARAARLRAERDAARATRRRLIAIVGAVVLVLGLVAGLVLAGAIGGGEEDEDVVADGDLDDFDTVPEALESGFAYGEGDCPTEKPDEPVRSFDDAPASCLEEGVDYGAVITTSEGEITVDLLEDEAPGTVNNFVVLARSAYFDDIDFHRSVTGFVVQGGDPTGTGAGDPGYAIADELPDSVAAYVEGALAMANAGPGTNGSQWFICLDCSSLPGPNYSLFGQVGEGQDVVEAINALSTPEQSLSEPVTIESVEITEG